MAKQKAVSNKVSSLPNERIAKDGTKFIKANNINPKDEIEFLTLMKNQDKEFGRLKPIDLYIREEDKTSYYILFLQVKQTNMLTRKESELDLLPPKVERVNIVDFKIDFNSTNTPSSLVRGNYKVTKILHDPTKYHTSNKSTTANDLFEDIDFELVEDTTTSIQEQTTPTAETESFFN